MTERLPPPRNDALTADQETAIKVFGITRGSPPFGPFSTLLHSPELMLRASALGEYLRYRTEFPPRLSELAIMITARLWDQPVEWQIHHPIAIKAGVAPQTIDAICEGKTPVDLTPEEQALYDFCTQLHGQRKVDDATYASALAAFGEKGVLDLAGICGYYALLAMAMNVAGTPASPNGPTLSPLP